MAHGREDQVGCLAERSLLFVVEESSNGFNELSVTEGADDAEVLDLLCNLGGLGPSCVGSSLDLGGLDELVEDLGVC